MEEIAKIALEFREALNHDNPDEMSGALKRAVAYFPGKTEEEVAKTLLKLAASTLRQG